MLVASIVCTSLLSLPYGLYRTRKYFGLSWRELAGWHQSALVLAFWLVPTGILTWWLTRNMSTVMRLGIGSGVFGLWTAWAFLRHGLNASLQVELTGRLPTWAKSILIRTVLKSET
jgi:hypothetical protein